MRLPPRRFTAPKAARDRWLIPYADLVTLLFAFFTALYAVTAVDASRLSTMAEGLRAAVGTPPTSAPVATGTTPGLPAMSNEIDRGDVSQARDAILRDLSDLLDANSLELMEDRRGLVLAIPESNSFDTGRAELSAEAQTLMTRIAGVLAGVPNALRVEGHTDDAPIHTQQFTSNWDLSTARATRVVDFLISRGGVAPVRLSAAGYSYYHPRASNESAQGRARNRRVDLVILNTATRSSEEPAPLTALDQSVDQSLDKRKP
jgi:chemotaxis protein MotB